MRQSLTADFVDAIAAVEQTGLFTSVCSINRPTQALNASGQVDMSDVTPVAGLQNIACMMSVFAPGSPNKGAEIRTPEYIAQLAEFHVLLDGYYTGIQQRDQAVVDGVALDILAAENDSQRTMTRLAVRRYQI